PVDRGSGYVGHSAGENRPGPHAHLVEGFGRGGTPSRPGDPFAASGSAGATPGLALGDDDRSVSVLRRHRRGLRSPPIAPGNRLVCTAATSHRRAMGGPFHCLSHLTP